MLTGTHDFDTTSVNCICATNPHCQSPVAIYDVDIKINYDYDFKVAYIVPGLTEGCFFMDSLLLSTLECFYSDSDCLPIIIDYIQRAYFQYTEYPSWFDVRPLVYDSRLSRFAPNTSIAMIVKNIMVEQWNPSSSYNRYYESCAPSHCTYSHTIRTKTTVGVLITLVSMIGGLSVSLRLITPQLVKFLFFLLRLKDKRQQQQQQQQQQRGNH